MRHIVSIIALLAVFFWAGPGSVRHVSARSVLVLASDENKKLSKEEAQAKAQAKRRYDNFMKVYNKIWIIYGFLHKEFKNTPGNVRYARIVKNWQSDSKHKKKLLDITNKLKGPSDLDAQAKAEGFRSRRQQLEQRAYYLINDIEDMRRKLADLKKQAARIGELAPTVNALMKKACAAKTRVEAKSLAKECIFEASDAIGSYKAVRDWILPEIEKKRKGYLAIRSDFESTGSLVRKHQDVYKDMIGSENAMLKDLQEVSTEHYLNNKRNRFNQLVTKLDKHHSELKRVSNPYKKHVWAKAMIDGAHAARDDAKKAVACAKKLPDEPTNSNKDHRCPSNWNDCGSRCCPPDVPCWNYEAMERAVKAGRCR